MKRLLSSMKSQSAYIDQHLAVRGTPSGPLAGRTVAVKDLFDIAGHKTGFGHPTWLETHDTATETAPAVQRLLDAGASVQGKTHMDELAYSLNGENFHYGTPANPSAPGRIPGGSSSGSAVAVAAGDVDIGLGSDTGGSVRVPASYCGVYGIRPTWGRVPLTWARPLAPSFDTVGWFTRSLGLLAATATVLLDPPTTPTARGNARWLVPTDLWDLTLPETATALKAALAAQAARGSTQSQLVVSLLEGAGDATGGHKRVRLAASEDLVTHQVDQITSWLDVFRICQAREIWTEHGPWITQHRPVFGPGIKERFAMASGITEQEFSKASTQRRAITQHLLSLLGSDGVLVAPTAPGPAPLCDTPAAQLDDWRRRLLSMTCVAGLGGLPQVSLPIATVGNLPVGLSLIGPPGSDEWLLERAKGFVEDRQE